MVVIDYFDCVITKLPPQIQAFVTLFIRLKDFLELALEKYGDFSHLKRFFVNE